MLTFGHTARAYLITKAPPFSKIKFNKLEMFLVIFAGNIFDMDVVWYFLSGAPIGAHHLFFGHTPLMGVIYFVVFYLLFRKRVKKQVFVMIALALFLHLFFDDLSYLLSLVGLTAHTHPEIFWLYPFDPRRNEVLGNFLANPNSYQYKMIEFMQYYITKTLLVFLLEILLIILALFFLIKNLIKNNIFKN